MELNIPGSFNRDFVFLLVLIGVLFWLAIERPSDMLIRFLKLPFSNCSDYAIPIFLLDLLFEVLGIDETFNVSNYFKLFLIF